MIGVHRVVVEVEFSLQTQGIMRLRRLVEMNVAVPLGLSTAMVLRGWDYVKLLGKAA